MLRLEPRVPTPIEFFAAGLVFTSKVVSRGLLLWVRWFSRGSASPRRFNSVSMDVYMVRLLASRSCREPSVIRLSALFSVDAVVL